MLQLAGAARTSRHAARRMADVRCIVCAAPRRTVRSQERVCTASTEFFAFVADPPVPAELSFEGAVCLRRAERAKRPCWAVEPTPADADGDADGGVAGEATGDGASELAVPLSCPGPVQVDAYLHFGRYFTNTGVPPASAALPPVLRPRPCNASRRAALRCAAGGCSAGSAWARRPCVCASFHAAATYRRWTAQEYGLSAACYKVVTDVKPNEAKGWAGLGYVAMGQSQYETAVDFLQRAFELEPTEAVRQQGLLIPRAPSARSVGAARIARTDVLGLRAAASSAQL